MGELRRVVTTGRATTLLVCVVTALLGPTADVASAQGRVGRLAPASTHYERFVRERHDTTVLDRHPIGDLEEETARATFVVVHAYEPGRASGHEAEAFALRIDVRTPDAAERVWTGWLDPYEVEGLARALPHLTQMLGTPAANDHYVQVQFPRGAVNIGFHRPTGRNGLHRLFIQVGRDGPSAFVHPDKFAALQELVAAAVGKLRKLRRDFGHRH